MKHRTFSACLILFGCCLSFLSSCDIMVTADHSMSPEQIFGNPEYQAISYGGYRTTTRDVEPTTDELKEDLKILSAMGIKLLRTYQAKQFPQAANLVQAISELKSEQPGFEMYVMVGAWIDCKDAWTDLPDHSGEDEQKNQGEIDAAIGLAKQYPDIVKAIAVGNESMVHWASGYFVEPTVILKWVKHLQKKKAQGDLPEALWITSSDNFAAWGGGSGDYDKPALIKLAQAVDFISMHTYPFHDTHYNPSFWQLHPSADSMSKLGRIDLLMEYATKYAQKQYASTKHFLDSIGVNKPMHIGETGWATNSSGFYGINGTGAADEYKQKKYHDLMRQWTDKEGISCFFFEAFDEPWKDDKSQLGSENHFGLISIDGQAKYVAWDWVDKGVFKGTTRNGNRITKSFDGNEFAIIEAALKPPSQTEDTLNMKK